MHVIGYDLETNERLNARDPQIDLELMEFSIIEAYKWTPSYIASLPYKWIQRHFHIKNAKRMASDLEQQKRELERQGAAGHISPGSKSYRNV